MPPIRVIEVPEGSPMKQEAIRPERQMRMPQRTDSSMIRRKFRESSWAGLVLLGGLSSPPDFRSHRRCYTSAPLLSSRTAEGQACQAEVARMTAATIRKNSEIGRVKKML